MALFHKDAFAIPMVLSCFVGRLSATGYHSNLCAPDLCSLPSPTSHVQLYSPIRSCTAMTFTSEAFPTLASAVHQASAECAPLRASVSSGRRVRD